MTAPSKPGSRIIPCLRYRNTHTAIGWLCHVFGVEPRTAHTTEHAVARAAALDARA